jgi:hypothetical protein
VSPACSESTLPGRGVLDKTPHPTVDYRSLCCLTSDAKHAASRGVHVWCQCWLQALWSLGGTYVGSACKLDAHAAEAVLHVQLSCAAGTAPLPAASVHGLQWSRPNSCWTACGEADWELLPQQQRWPQQVCHCTQQLSDRLLFQKIVCGHTSECGYCLSCVPQSMLLLTPQILLLIPCCFVSLSRSFSHLAAGVVHSCLCHHLAGQQRSKLLPANDAAGRPARRQH